jgi:hypothetical protein
MKETRIQIFFPNEKIHGANTSYSISYMQNQKSKWGGKLGIQDPHQGSEKKQTGKIKVPGNPYPRCISRSVYLHQVLSLDVVVMHQDHLYLL